MSYGEKVLLSAGVCGLLLGVVLLILYMLRKIPFAKIILSGLSAIVILLVLALSVWAILQSTGVVDPVFLEWFKKIAST